MNFSILCSCESVSVVFFQPSFYCCFHIFISFDLPNVASMLETDKAPSVRLQIYVETSVKRWLEDEGTDLYRHRIEEHILQHARCAGLHGDMNAV